MNRFLAVLICVALAASGIACQSNSSEPANYPAPAAVPSPAPQGTPSTATDMASKDPAAIAESAMAEPLDYETAMASGRQVDWTHLAKARVTRLDNGAKVAMLDVGKTDGITYGDRLYTFKDNRVTGMLIVIKVFGQISICLAGTPPAGNNVGKLAVGDHVAPNVSIVYPGSVYPDDVVKQLKAGKSMVPPEEQLKSLQQSIDSAHTGKNVDHTAQDAVASKTLKARDKQVEDSWKETLANVKKYQSMVKLQ